MFCAKILWEIINIRCLETFTFFFLSSKNSSRHLELALTLLLRAQHFFFFSFLIFTWKSFILLFFVEIFYVNLFTKCRYTNGNRLNQSYRINIKCWRTIRKCFIANCPRKFSTIMSKYHWKFVCPLMKSHSIGRCVDKKCYSMFEICMECKYAEKETKNYKIIFMLKS